MEIYDAPFPMDETLCKDCFHRLSRVLMPIDYDALELDFEKFNINVEDGDEITLEQHICLVSNEDLETLVLKCSHFKKNNRESEFLGSKLF